MAPSGKESTCQCRRRRRCGFDLWVGKIPWSRRWQPTPVFLLGEFPGQRAWRATVHGGAKSWTWLSNPALADVAEIWGCTLNNLFVLIAEVWVQFCKMTGDSDALVTPSMATGFCYAIIKGEDVTNYFISTSLKFYIFTTGITTSSLQDTMWTRCI